MELLTTKNLRELLQCSQQSLWRKRKQDNFPKPVQALLPSLRWRKTDIEAWLKGDQT